MAPLDADGRRAVRAYVRSFDPRLTEEDTMPPTPPQHLPSTPQCLAHSGVCARMDAQDARIKAAEAAQRATDARVDRLDVEIATTKESIRPWLSALTAALGAGASAALAYLAAGGFAG